MSKTKSSPKKVRKASKNGKGKGSRMKVGTPKTPKGVADAMYKFMCKEHSLGIKEWTKMELANEVGFTSPRSDKCGKGFKVLVNNDKLAEKASSKSDALVLTAEGIALKPAESEPTDIHDFHNRLKMGLKHKTSLGKDKVDKLWSIMIDRQVHDIHFVAKQLGYQNPRSFLNTKIIANMKLMNLAKIDSEKGKLQMTDKPFPLSFVEDDSIITV